MKSKIIITVISFFIFISWNTSEYHSSNKILEEQIVWQGIKRTFLVHVPKNTNSNASLPILFNLHGGGGNARQAISATFGRFNRLADDNGFIVVYPNAINKNWNDGRLASSKPGQEDIDDVGFIDEIIKHLSHSYKIDHNRIYTSGISNGGFMSSRLLCDRAHVFSGGAILAATLSNDYLSRCNPLESTSVLIMNGTHDKIVPYEGGQVVVLNKPRGKEIASTKDLIEFWKSSNNCSSTAEVLKLPNRKKFDGTTVRIEEYSRCDNDVSLALFKIVGGGHTWPGGRQYLPRKMVGNTTREINACDEIVKFFQL
tara:strand:+ start:2171 stop:3109 length:939 start_codon:yes stop_codon:yes gene_type:complete